MPILRLPFCSDTAIRAAVLLDTAAASPLSSPPSADESSTFSIRLLTKRPSIPIPPAQRLSYAALNTIKITSLIVS